MTRKKESTKEDQKFTCSNSSCGLAFSKPIKVKNLRVEHPEFYDACPRCLTAISIEEPIPIAEATPSEVVSDSRSEESLRSLEEKKEERAAETSCAHNFGYLSKRPRNEGIPEECMVCENIVKCMLKAVNG